MDFVNQLLDGLLRVVVVEPNKVPYSKVIQNELREMKKLIGGGYLETFPLWATYPQLQGLVGVCDEDGKNNGLPYNCSVFQDWIAGTFFVCGVNPPDFSSLNDAQAQQVIEALADRA